MNNKFKREYGFNIFHQQIEDQFEYASTHGLQHIEINLSHEKLSVEKYDANRISKIGELSKAHKVNLSFHIPYYINISEIVLPLRKSNINYLL